MKKCLFGALAAVAALFTTSCAKDAQVAEVTLADATVTFGVTAPELGSRADAEFGNGKSAQKLTVLVYDKNGYRDDLSLIGNKALQMRDDLTQEAKIERLIKGETYSFLFWAQAEAAECFTLDAANGKVAIDYAKAMNNENVDAFFAQELNVRVDNALSKTVILKRPFAQINLGTDDMGIFTAQNPFAAATSTLTIKNIYNMLDLHDGSVAGDSAVTIPAAAIPTVGLTFPVGTEHYNYLALNYVLVATDKALVDVDYAIDNIADIATAKTVSLTGVPVQRNYRTNLYGSLFTTNATFNVEIVPGFVNEFNNDKIAYAATVNGKGYDSLADAINDVKGGASNTTIMIPSDTAITDQISFADGSVNQNITLEGAEDGSSVLDISAYNPTRWNGITVKNMTIKTANTTYQGFQHAGEIKFENCKFEGLFFGYGTHEIYENCTFEQTASDYCMWTYGASIIDYIGCTFKSPSKFIHCYKEGGAGANNPVRNINVENCKFIATSYGIYGAVYIKTGDINVAVNIKNCVLDGKFTSTNGGLWKTSGAYNEFCSVKVDGVEVYQK